MRPRPAEPATQMKVPDIYHNWRTMLGIALILLGTGNWLVGRLNTERYGELIRNAGSIADDPAYRSFDELNDSGGIGREIPRP